VSHPARGRWRLGAGSASALVAAVVAAAVVGQAAPEGATAAASSPLAGYAASSWCAPLGAPTGPEVRSADGRGASRAYELGSLYWSGTTGARAVVSLLPRYAQLGAERSWLGYPSTDEGTTPDGVAYQHFTGGSMYLTPGGARALRGPVLQRWAAGGWERSVGYPTTDTTSLALRGGSFAHFDRGSVYASPTTGARVVSGAVRDAWARQGWEWSALGYPTAEQGTTPDQRAVYQHFEGGSLYVTSSGARTLLAPARTAWASMGWERSALGYPTTDRASTPDGRGWYQHFEGGSLYSTPTTGVQAVTGPARGEWARQGWERSALGYPVASTRTTPTGTTTAFEGGRVDWDSATGRATTTLTPR